MDVSIHRDLEWLITEKERDKGIEKENAKGIWHEDLILHFPRWHIKTILVKSLIKLLLCTIHALNS